MSRPPRIANWLPWEQSTIYFVTFCVQDRKKVLANPTTWKICRDTWAKFDHWTVLSALAMPDHMHLLIGPVSDRDESVTTFCKWFKRWFNERYWELPPAGRSWTWQEGGFDRLLRSDESLTKKWEYIRQNPVRAGLVNDPDDWPYQFQFNAESEL